MVCTKGIPKWKSIYSDLRNGTGGTMFGICLFAYFWIEKQHFFAFFFSFYRWKKVTALIRDLITSIIMKKFTHFSGHVWTTKKLWWPFLWRKNQQRWNVKQILRVKKKKTEKNECNAFLYHYKSSNSSRTSNFFSPPNGKQANNEEQQHQYHANLTWILNRWNRSLHHKKKHMHRDSAE